MKTVECIARFHDLTDNAIRVPGDMWETTAERAKELADKGYVKILAAAKEK